MNDSGEDQEYGGINYLLQHIDFVLPYLICYTIISIVGILGI